MLPCLQWIQRPSAQWLANQACARRWISPVIVCAGLAGGGPLWRASVFSRASLGPAEHCFSASSREPGAYNLVGSERHAAFQISLPLLFFVRAAESAARESKTRKPHLRFVFSVFRFAKTFPLLAYAFSARGQRQARIRRIRKTAANFTTLYQK